MTVHSVATLISETRRLAADYYQSTGQSLPVTNEISRYDAINLLQLTEAEQTIAGVDAICPEGKKIQIKGRVIFDEAKSGQRIGQLNLDGEWDDVVLVLLDKEYQATEIYRLARQTIQSEIEASTSKRMLRGAMSVAKFRAIADKVWANSNESSEDNS